MKQTLKYIFLVLAFAALLTAAVYGYRYLSERYTPDTPETKEDAPAEKQSESKTSEPAVYDFVVMDMDGNPVHLTDHIGKPIVVNFWATWCGPCKSELPAFEEMYNTYKDDVTFMMVNMTDGSRETVDGVKAFLEDAGYTFPVYFDTEYIAAYVYGVSSIPMTVFMNEKAEVVDAYIGSMQASSLRSYIERLIGGA